jgi:hypothetical protein
VTKAVAIPTWVTLTPNIRVVDLLDAAATSSPSRGTYAAAVARIKKYVDSMGANDAGLTLAAGAGAK